MSQLSISAEWMPGGHGSAEVTKTAAFMRITADSRAITQVEDDWSKSVRDDVLLAAYPLAQWLAACWWRLCWEPASDHAPRASWRMAHHMTAAGHGFVWPRVVFAPDG